MCGSKLSYPTGHATLQCGPAYGVSVADVASVLVHLRTGFDVRADNGPHVRAGCPRDEERRELPVGVARLEPGEAMLS